MRVLWFLKNRTFDSSFLDSERNGKYNGRKLITWYILASQSNHQELMTAHWNVNLGLRLRRFDQWSIPVGVYSRYWLIGCFINIIPRFRIVRDCASEMAFDWFVNDVAGIVCSAITYLLVLYSQFVIVSVVLLPDPIVSETIQVRLCSFLKSTVTGQLHFPLLHSTNYLQVHSFKFLRNLVLVEWEGFHIFTKFA